MFWPSSFLDLRLLAAPQRNDSGSALNQLHAISAFIRAIRGERNPKIFGTNRPEISPLVDEGTKLPFTTEICYENKT